MAVENWQEFLKQTDGRLAELRPGIPGVMKGFGEIAKSAIGTGALEPKQKELIAISIGVAARCDACLGYHAKACIKYGVTREELMEALGVAVYMGGGPSLMYAAEALSAFDALLEEAK
ncbi:Carboxymuconolactone decarboxylase [Pseudovibrio sp. FO-BEG1]|uniref:Alkylhydroperoxidase AhpD family core domain-containing protein n=3 Tax=Pseudovibrio TaxID=258255 RepID=A0A1I7B3A6_9HYPH|nr:MULTISPECIES: carboxymuconolactone decarboxylase family protein [Pseudovibrio]AEV35121.1 Carboxymuconolactone decarboxylase [Pseudovibrio sp. FO-BEG1]EEA95228.1 alkylhydroperoxidase AhpD core [Pseudovibrio sp. JE062]QUS56081.1 carboxymuconolactone decarboxylase family protein [Pseudovibrio brasiliensis]SFT81608.1 alkylhydroperoxidase AhpD family core domain-containing protein [Pseudovibrio denitrificans]